MSRLKFDTIDCGRQAIYDERRSFKHANMVKTSSTVGARNSFIHKPYTNDYAKSGCLNDKKD